MSIDVSKTIIVADKKLKAKISLLLKKKSKSFRIFTKLKKLIIKNNPFSVSWT